MFERITFQTSDFFCFSPNPRPLFVYTISFPRFSSLLRAAKQVNACQSHCSLPSPLLKLKLHRTFFFTKNYTAFVAKKRGHMKKRYLCT